MMCLPTSVDPVKTILRTSGCETKRSPTTEPLPGITMKTSSGSPASRASSARRIAVSGVSSAGLSTTVLPAASAGAKPQPAIGIGKFHGTMTPTTPSGSLNVRSTPPATGIWRPNSRSGRAAVVGEDVADVAGLPARVAQRVAGAGHLEQRELLVVGVDDLAEPAQQPRAVGRRHVPPGVEGLVGARDRRVRLRDVGERDRRHDLFGRRVEHVCESASRSQALEPPEPLPVGHGRPNAASSTRAMFA